MARRSPYAAAAEGWMREHATPGEPIPTKRLWSGLCSINPDITAPNERRKTPRNTCMRDLRKDDAFVVGSGKVTLKG